MNAFAYPARALRDPRQGLVKLAHATVKPEAAVFTHAVGCFLSDFLR